MNLKLVSGGEADEDAAHKLLFSASRVFRPPIILILLHQIARVRVISRFPVHPGSCGLVDSDAVFSKSYHVPS